MMRIEHNLLAHAEIHQEMIVTVDERNKGLACGNDYTSEPGTKHKLARTFAA